MKKSFSLVKPFFPVIVGTLLLLLFVNFLRAGGTALAIGIVATVLGAFYICAGLLPTLFGGKLPNSLNKVFEIGCVIGLPVFLFVTTLLSLINNADNYQIVGWIIALLALVAYLGFAVVYLISNFVLDRSLGRIKQVFALCVVLMLVLNLTFTDFGNTVALGDLPIAVLALDGFYLAILCLTLAKPVEYPEKAAPQEEPQPQEQEEQSRPEEQPQSEEPQEEPAPEEPAQEEGEAPKEE